MSDHLHVGCLHLQQDCYIQIVTSRNNWPGPMSLGSADVWFVLWVTAVMFVQQEFIRLGCLSKLSGKGLQQRMFFLVWCHFTLSWVVQSFDIALSLFGVKFSSSCYVLCLSHVTFLSILPSSLIHISAPLLYSNSHLIHLSFYPCLLGHLLFLSWVAFNVRTYCMLYVLAIIVRTYCVLYAWH